MKDKKCSICEKKEFDKIVLSVLNEDFGTPDYSKEKPHYSYIKDLDVPRPRMAPKPDTSSLPTKSYGAKFCDLYLQDQASAVIIDKYGFQKGYKAWLGLIDFSSGAMFASSAQIANEKYVMCKNLNLLADLKDDYFFRSYFDIWKQWKATLQVNKKPAVRKEEVLKENVADIDKYAGIINYFVNGLKFLSTIKLSELSADSADTIHSLAADIIKLRDDLAYDTEKRNN